jgi:phage recombination protein Bet
MENHSSEIVTQSGHSNKLQQNQNYDQKKIDLIKRTICKGATDDELQLFIQTCNKTGLDPFMRQIFSVKRWDSSEKREVMTIQTGIDGYRLIADRTGRYAPGQNPEFGYDKQGNLRFAKSYVKKKTSDGTWHEVSAIAFWDEYVQKTKQGEATHFWKSKGHIMLSKCAEMLALRRAFPAELSGLHVQSEEIPHEAFSFKEEAQEQKLAIPEKLSKEQLEKLELLLSQFADSEEKTSRILSFIEVKELKDIPKSRFETLVSQLENQLVSNG